MSEIPANARRSSLMATVAMLAALGAAQAAEAAPTSSVTDMGAVPGAEQIFMHFYLYPNDPVGLDALVAAVQTPGNPAFHHFLTEAQFVAGFAPTPATVANVEATLRGMGFTITGVTANKLEISVTSTAAPASAMLRLQLRSVIRTAADGSQARGMVSRTAPVLPASLAPFVHAVGGTDTLPRATPAGATATTPPLTNEVLSPSLGLTDIAGHLKPADYEHLYDVAPLAAQATGQGVTIAIVGSQPVSTADALAFWKSIGLAVPASHLAPSILIDGGSDSTAINESSIDIETSGGIASGAVIQPYVTSGSATGLLDGFERVASDNTAAVASLSYDNPEPNALIPLEYDGSPELAEVRTALHDVFEEMAVQGQTVFVASGDAGAFAINRGDQYPVFTTVGQPPRYTPAYSVGTYTADPLVTACGGTLLPFTAVTSLGFPITVPSEQAWSGSVFVKATLEGGGDAAQVENSFETWFPAGGGGGISIYWPVPDYQKNLPGILETLPDQALYALSGSSRTLYAAEPAFFPGRNLPDLSADSSQLTGYGLIEHGTYAEGSGTSIVAPQFAATAALMVQALGHRIGQLNPLLYALQARGAAPARTIATGDDWGFPAHPGYAQTNGLGAMDGEKLYEGLRSYDADAAQ